MRPATVFDLDGTLVRATSAERLLVPYLVRIIDSLERHGGLYQAKLAEVMPESVVEEIEDWLKSHLADAGEELRSEVLRPQGIEARLVHLERIFPERADDAWLTN